jgi:hypothetical protein
MGLRDSGIQSRPPQSPPHRAGRRVVGWRCPGSNYGVGQTTTYPPTPLPARGWAGLGQSTLPPTPHHGAGWPSTLRNVI